MRVTTAINRAPACTNACTPAPVCCQGCAGSALAYHPASVQPAQRRPWVHSYTRGTDHKRQVNAAAPMCSEAAAVQQLDKEWLARDTPRPGMVNKQSRTLSSQECTLCSAAGLLLQIHCVECRSNIPMRILSAKLHTCMYSNCVQSARHAMHGNIRRHACCPPAHTANSPDGQTQQTLCGPGE